ncbi:unnamed protein product [Urochloa humidicola]
MATNAVQAIRAALCLLLALAVANCAFAGRVLDEQEQQPAAPAEAPLPADPLPPPRIPPPTRSWWRRRPAQPPQRATQELPPPALQRRTQEPPAARATTRHPLTFFMHDILGGSQPSGRIVSS